MSALQRSKGDVDLYEAECFHPLASVIDALSSPNLLDNDCVIIIQFNIFLNLIKEILNMSTDNYFNKATLSCIERFLPVPRNKCCLQNPPEKMNIISKSS